MNELVAVISVENLASKAAWAGGIAAASHRQMYTHTLKT